MQAYELRPVVPDPPSLKLIAGLLQVAFPGAQHFTEQVLQWQYRENPAGEVVGFNAWHGDELAGHYVTIPMMALWGGRPERGLLSLNTATHPNHQGKGLFTKLAKATYDLAAGKGFGFVAGVANANSTPGFTRKLGFELVSPLRAMIGIGPLPFAADPVDVQFAHRWDVDSVAWRLRHPAYRYTMREERGRAVILSARRQFGARYVLGVREPGLVGGTVASEPGPVRRKVWIGLDPAMKWGGKAYLNIPQRFRPAPLNLIFKDLAGGGRRPDPSKTRWDVMDFDIL